MCGFYARAELNRTDFQKIYGVDDIDDALLSPRYNIRPGTVNVVVTRNSPNKAQGMLWSYLPDWPGFPESRAVINARIESIKEGKSFFKKAFLSQRCIVPASQWVEWAPVSGIKIPHAFKLKGRDNFSFAGLWSEYTNRNGKRIKGYCIITTEPNPLASKVHNRQPAILRKSDENTWLDPDEKDMVTLLKCLDVYPQSDMEAYPIVRDLSENSPDILKPITKNQLETQIAKKPKLAKRLKTKIPFGQVQLV